MIYLLKSAILRSPGHSLNGKKVDLLVTHGKINQLSGKSITETKVDEVIDCQGLSISPGWFDMQVNFREPGYEYKEEIATGLEAAKAGGFTGVALMPSTKPAIQSRSEVEYVIRKAQNSGVDLIPVGCISVNREGVDIAEMYDMYQAGARAFSDDQRPVKDAGLMLRVLQYSLNFGGLVFSFPEDTSISGKGQVNESEVTISLGIKTSPAMAEELCIARDIELSKYAEAPIHFNTISTSKGVELIRQAKKAGLQVSAGVSMNHLVLDDSSLEGFDSNFKIKPPLRSKADRKALIAGLKDGTIDVIVSDHRPEDEESKVREFEHASYGTIGLESLFGLAGKYIIPEIGMDNFINAVSIKPRILMDAPQALIETGANANFTIFSEDEEYDFDKKHIRSKSMNTPYLGELMKGKVKGVLNQGVYFKVD